MKKNRCTHAFVVIRKRLSLQYFNVKNKKKTRKVFILAASSLHHALETLTREEKEQFDNKVYSIPGLSLNLNTKNPKKVVQNLLSKDLAGKNDIVIWHDVRNNSISRHDSNNFCSLSVRELIEVLKGFQDKL